MRVAIKDAIRWLWRRDSESASLLCMEASSTMTDEDLRNTAEFFLATVEWRVKYGESK